MVEFTEKTSIDLTQFHTVGSAKGTLGLITLNNDVFLCVITGAEEVANVRPRETVQRIFAVEFCGCNSNGDLETMNKFLLTFCS